MYQAEEAKLAVELMNQGYNCCEAVMITADRTWDLQLPPELLQSANFFEEGMSRGCTCGALVGLVAVSGVLYSRYGHPLGKKLPAHLHDSFKQKFGSTCCRVICRQRPLVKKISKTGCKELTGQTVDILKATWEGVINGGNTNLRDYSYHQ